MERCYYKVDLIAEGTYRIADYLGDLMYLVIGGERALLIDTGLGFGGLREVVEELTDREVLVMNTHGHLDHIGGNGQFGQVMISMADREVYREHGTLGFREKIRELVKEIGSDLTKEEVERLIHQEGMDGGEWRELENVMDLGGRMLRVLAVPGHTPGSVCVWEEKTGMLFSGDMLCDEGIMLSFPESMGLFTFMDSMRVLREEAITAAAVYPGHHTNPISIEFAREYEELAKAVLTGEHVERQQEHSVFGDHVRIRKGRISLTLADKDVN